MQGDGRDTRGERTGRVGGFNNNYKGGEKREKKENCRKGDLGVVSRRSGG